MASRLLLAVMALGPFCCAQSPEAQAHDAVVRFLQGIKLSALPEGKKMLAETQWIVGPADRGANFYFRPEYTEINSLYAGLFDTDVALVKGYKELFDMKATTKAGTTVAVKYLVIAFRDTDSGKWKILRSLGDDALDIDHEVEYARQHLTETDLLSARERYAGYGGWLLAAGRIKEAKASLETAKKSSPISPLTGGVDPIRDVQIDAVLDLISRISSPAR